MSRNTDTYRLNSLIFTLTHCIHKNHRKIPQTDWRHSNIFYLFKMSYKSYKDLFIWSSQVKPLIAWMFHNSTDNTLGLFLLHFHTCFLQENTWCEKSFKLALSVERHPWYTTTRQSSHISYWKKSNPMLLKNKLFPKFFQNMPSSNRVIEFLQFLHVCKPDTTSRYLHFLQHLCSVKPHHQSCPSQAAESF